MVAACGHPKLFDKSCYLYGDRAKKERAWQKVSEKVGHTLALPKVSTTAICGCPISIPVFFFYLQQFMFTYVYVCAREVCQRNWKVYRVLKKKRKKEEKKNQLIIDSSPRGALLTYTTSFHFCIKAFRSTEHALMSMERAVRRAWTTLTRVFHLHYWLKKRKEKKKPGTKNTFLTSVIKAFAVAGLMNSTALRSVSLYRCSSSTRIVRNRLVIIMLILDSTFCRETSIPCWEVRSRKSSIPRISGERDEKVWLQILL